MRNAWHRWIVFCALFVTQGCRAPSPDWDGTWKLNFAKSSFQGTVFTISTSADGEYHYDDGRSSFTLQCDGKYRPIGNNRTRVCVKSGARVLDIIQKENGVKTKATRWELSSDRKNSTSTVTEFRPSGPIMISQTNLSRLSGANDFAGQWRDTSYLQQHADMTLRLDNQALHIDYPDTGQYIDAPLDGVEAAVRGPHVLEGMTYSARPVERREIRTLRSAMAKFSLRAL